MFKNKLIYTYQYILLNWSCHLYLCLYHLMFPRINLMKFDSSLNIYKYKQPWGILCKSRYHIAWGEICSTKALEAIHVIQWHIQWHMSDVVPEFYIEHELTQSKGIVIKITMKRLNMLHYFLKITQKSCSFL